MYGGGFNQPWNHVHDCHNVQITFDPQMLRNILLICMAQTLVRTDGEKIIFHPLCTSRGGILLSIKNFFF